MSDTYRIAGFDLRLLAPHFRFRGLEPFRLPAGSPEEEPLLLALACDPATRTADPADRLLDTFDFPEANACCRLYRYGGGCLFVMTVAEGAAEVRFDLPDTGPDARCNIPAGGDPSLFRFGLWMAFNLRAAARGALAIHASAVVHRGEAVLCLGRIGDRQEHPHAAVARDDRGGEAAQRRQSDPPHLRRRGAGLRLSLERQDPLLPQSELPHSRIPAAAAGPREPHPAAQHPAGLRGAAALAAPLVRPRCGPLPRV